MFFYGARTRADLFYLEEIEALRHAHPEIEFIPVLSHAAEDANWRGERGFVHERVDARLKQLALDGAGDVYACGPPPMIDALQPVLFMNGFEVGARVLRSFHDLFRRRVGSLTASAWESPAQSEWKSGEKGEENGRHIEFGWVGRGGSRQVCGLRQPPLPLFRAARAARDAL